MAASHEYFFLPIIFIAMVTLLNFLEVINSFLGELLAGEMVDYSTICLAT